jgi:acetyltransferase
MQHYLRPLLSPTSVAMVGASERDGSVGRTALANLLAAGFTGAIYPVNPRHSTVLGQRAWPTLKSIAAPVELAVIATPAAAVLDVLEQAPAVGLQAAVVMTAPPAGAEAQRWNRDVVEAARRHGVRLVGAGAFGVIRTDIGLDATFCAPTARKGRLALVAQSGAVATALLDFAAPQHIGFSTVISLGTGLDVGIGEMLDCLVQDSATDAILLFIEDVGAARPFMSALRSAARVKPAIVLKVGRSVEPVRHPSSDRVVDAALRRAGAVRVQNYTQLFAAARILATGRIPRSDRLAIVSNGRGPALLAADRVAERGVELAHFGAATIAALDALLPADSPRANPVDLRGDAPAARMADAVARVLDDPSVDAVVALHVARPSMPAEEAARRVGEVARQARKPVLGAWLGALDRPGVQAALDAGDIVNFYTPENAVDAFSFLATYRRNQAWLLEVPPLQPEPSAIDLDAAERLRARLAGTSRVHLLREEIALLLGAFGIDMAPCATVTTREEASAAIRRLHYPVTLTAAHGAHPWTRTVRDSAGLERAWREVAGLPALEGSERPQVTMEKIPRGETSDIAIGIATDPKFGPVIVAGAGGRVDGAGAAVMLPPLNRRLAEDLVAEVRGRSGRPGFLPATVEDALTGLMVRLSTLAGALPWVVELSLSRVVQADGRATVGEARAMIDATRIAAPGYRHMAIHPYPVELIEDVVLRDGATLTIRPIRPEDGELEREFVDGLSPESRYYRFFYQLHELTPAMLARFTQVDYDREMALVAITDIGHPHGHPSFVGVARYIANPDGESAEFAVVVADDWQKRGVAHALMTRLIRSATDRGLARLDGSILRSNVAMLAFVAALGFTACVDPDEPEQVKASLELGGTLHSRP